MMAEEMKVFGLIKLVSYLIIPYAIWTKTSISQVLFEPTRRICIKPLQSTSAVTLTCRRARSLHIVRRILSHNAIEARGAMQKSGGWKRCPPWWWSVNPSHLFFQTLVNPIKTIASGRFLVFALIQISGCRFNRILTVPVSCSDALPHHEKVRQNPNDCWHGFLHWFRLESPSLKGWWRRNSQTSQSHFCPYSYTQSTAATPQSISCPHICCAFCMLGKNKWIAMLRFFTALFAILRLYILNNAKEACQLLGWYPHRKIWSHLPQSQSCWVAKTCSTLICS